MGVESEDARVWVRFAPAPAVTDPGTRARELSVQARSVARGLVAEVAGVSEQSVRLGHRCFCGRVDHGRPVVLTSPDLHLSVGHGPTVICVALTRLGLVGVDVEPVRTINVTALSPHVLGPHDAPAPDSATFLRTWVRKEAVIKATGDGLTVPLAEVGVGGESPVGPLIPYPGGPIQGFLADLAAPTQHCAALATLGVTVPQILVSHLKRVVPG